VGRGMSGPWARWEWITYTHWQLKRKHREKEECSSWNAISSHVCSKSPEFSLILACLRSN
jgi:hypothetical protein